MWRTSSDFRTRRWVTAVGSDGCNLALPDCAERRCSSVDSLEDGQVSTVTDVVAGRLSVSSKRIAGVKRDLVSTHIMTQNPNLFKKLRTGRYRQPAIGAIGGKNTKTGGTFANRFLRQNRPHLRRESIQLLKYKRTAKERHCKSGETHKPGIYYVVCRRLAYFRAAQSAAFRSTRSLTALARAW